MKKILAFAGSNSSRSINHQLVTYAADQIENHHVQVIKLSDYTLPLFSIDIENEKGFSNELKALHELIKESDGIIMSVNEHNSGVSAFFKNTTDWLSRFDRKFLEEKKILLMSCSTGGRGAISALDFAKKTLPRFGAEIIETFSFPNFNDNFSREENTITNNVLKESLNSSIQHFVLSLID
jgi:NAD(P)H-dependent FMN reductase